MNETVFDIIQKNADILKVDLSASELAAFAEHRDLDQEQLSVVQDLFCYLAEKKHNTMITTLMRTSRLPIKQPKTFSNFDFSVLHGKHVDRIQALDTLSPLYAHKNLAFIGPQGVGKTHLAMAFGHECCRRGLKTYFLKASELNQRLTAARMWVVR